MLHHLKSIYRTPTVKEIALRELQEAEMTLLHMHSQAEYAGAMVVYHANRILRLKAYLTTTKE